MRATNGSATRQRRNKILNRAEGYRGARSRLYRNAKETVLRAEQFAFIGRRLKKRDFRKLWIIRLSAAVKQYGMNYSRFINGLKRAEIQLNRKELSELAIHEPKAFEAIVEKAKAALV